MNGKGELIQLEKALSHLKLTHDKFIAMCVAAGCDYLKNIKTIGINKAKQLVQKENFLDELQKHKYAPENYRESFAQARSVFLHQHVYNIKTKKVQPFHEWEGNEGLKEKQACGQYPLKAIFK